LKKLATGVLAARRSGSHLRGTCTLVTGLNCSSSCIRQICM